MCFGTVSITHDDITEDISSGDLVVISAGELSLKIGSQYWN